MTTSKYPADFRARFCRQEWNSLTEMQREVMCRQYELYDALRRAGSQMDQPSFMLAHPNKVRHSPCSRCCGDDQYIAHRAMIFKELEDELEEQHQRRLSQQAEEPPAVTARKRRVKSEDSVLKDTIIRNVNRTKVGAECSSESTKRKQRTSIQRRKEDSKQRDRSSSKHRPRSEQARKMNSVKKNSYPTMRTASHLYNIDPCNQRSKLRNKTFNKRSSEIHNKPSSEERSSCENSSKLQEYFNEEETDGTGFRIPAEGQDPTIFGRQATSPSFVTPELHRGRRVTFEELDEIFNDTHSREQQVESLRCLLREKVKEKVIPDRHTYSNNYHFTRNQNQTIPKTQIIFSLPTIQRKRIPRNKKEVTASRDFRVKQEARTKHVELTSQAAHKDMPSYKRKSLPCVKTTREHNVRGGYKLRKQQPKEKNKVNISPSEITNTLNKKRSIPSATQRGEWITSTSIIHKTDYSLLQPPTLQQSKRRSASKISEPKRVITSRNVEQNLERCNRKQKECVPEHCRRHVKKKRVSSISDYNMAKTCLREPTEQGCFHWASADKTQVMRDTCAFKDPTTSSLPRTNKKRLGRNKKLGNSWKGDGLKYGRVGEKIPHALLKEVEPINKKVQFDAPRRYSTRLSRNWNKT